MANQENKKQEKLADIDMVDVEPLTDADLDTVAGGSVSPKNTATTGCPTTNNATTGC